MGYSAAAVIDYVVTAFEAGSAAEGAGAAASTAAEAGATTAAEAGTGAAVSGSGLSATGSGVGLSTTGSGVGLSTGTTTATLGGSGAAGGATGGGISLGTAAQVGSLASTAYALTKGVPKVPTPGTITPADNGGAIAKASDAEARDRARALAGGASSTMLTGGRGSGLGATTSSALLGS